MHEIIALGQRQKRREKTDTVEFSLARIDAARFHAQVKGPAKTLELRAERFIARPQPRLAFSERTGSVEKWTHRIVKAGKLRLFRMWKLFGEAEAAALAAIGSDAVPRPLAERLAWLRRSRRL
ncbi:MAG: hypothetical protein ABI321_12960 [Polyangia bacterium]